LGFQVVTGRFFTSDIDRFSEKGELKKALDVEKCFPLL